MDATAGSPVGIKGFSHLLSRPVIFSHFSGFA